MPEVQNLHTKHGTVAVAAAATLHASFFLRMLSTIQAETKPVFLHIMKLIWSPSPTSAPKNLRDRILLGIMDPSLKTFTITMPTVGVFLFGTALCCFCCFKYGLQRWYERTLTKTRTKSRTGITYAESLQYKKDQLEKALNKVMKLRKVEPDRTDLKYEALALKEGIRMLNEHLRNSERYADYCEGMKRPSLEGTYNKKVSFDFKQESAFVNPMFSSQQAINSGYMIDPVKTNIEPPPPDSSSNSEDECHNPKHKELKLYLMSTGGTIRPSLLKFPETVTNTSPGFPSGHVQRSRAGSPLGRQEIDSEGRSFNMSPPLQREPGSSIDQAAFPSNEQNIADAARFVQPRPGVSQTWQPSSSDRPNFGSISRASSPNFGPGGPSFSPSNPNTNLGGPSFSSSGPTISPAAGPSFSPGPTSANNSSRGTQPRISP